ncbi:hypothetical protein WKH57_01105 [Niallia taxi]|uniref:hypothetical protein n=1 Tax=Niallia taxi TaxID=2499688 RepID=UPI00316B0118
MSYNDKINSFCELVRSKGYEINPIGSVGFVVSKNSNFNVRINNKVIFRVPFHQIFDDIENEFKKLEENREILNMIGTIHKSFKMGVEVIEKMFKEMERDSFKQYISKSHSFVNNPMEDAIRFKVITITEMFKRVARAIKETNFNWYPVKNPDKYYIMNKVILESDEVIDEIDRILNQRNNLAHVWVEGYLDFIKVNREEVLNDLDFLRVVLKEYKKYIRSTLI